MPEAISDSIRTTVCPAVAAHAENPSLHREADLKAHASTSTRKSG